MEIKINRKYIELKDLEIYRLARELSRIGWQIYENLDWQTKKIIGNQFIESADSVGANIAEGYARFHYKDKIKFYYNARGSLSETGNHWIGLLKERSKVNNELYEQYVLLAKKIEVKLNNFITSHYNSKSREA